MLIINLMPVSAGGGLQNALSFLHQLASKPISRHVVVACREGSLIHRCCVELALTHEAFPDSLASRIACELWHLRALGRRCGAQVIFTIFGNPPFNSGSMIRISGFAYSNIIQREVPFWNFLPPPLRLAKQAKDLLRLWLAKRSDELILETDYLRERAMAGVFAGKTLHVVKMEPSLLVTSSVERSADKPREGGITLLCLAGAHPNKRVHLLAAVTMHLEKLGVPRRVITTMPPAARYFRQVEDAFRQAGAGDKLENLGPIGPGEVAALLRRVDAVVNVALLESFSNNWVEAWASEKVLIATDAEWSRRSCGRAAIYVDPNAPAQAALAIAAGMKEREPLLAAGAAQLQELSLHGRKIDQYIEIIQRHLQSEGVQ